MGLENKVIRALKAAQSTLSSSNPILQNGQRVYATGISLSVRSPRKLGDGSTAYNDLPFIDTLQIETSSDYDLTQTFLAVNGNEVEITNTGSSSIIITTTGDPVTLGAGETGKFRRILGSWVATAASAGGGGIPNYLGSAASDWTVETGWTLTEETSSPIDLEGTISAVVANGTADDVGFYQDVIISEIDKNKLLQLNFYFADDSNSDFSKIDFEVIDIDDEAIILEGNLLDYSSYNNASGIYLFNATPQTTGNINYRVRIKTNDTLATQMDMYFSRFFLGQPSTFTAPLNGLEAGQMYYSTEAPSLGLNAVGDLNFDGSTTHALADYPDLAAKETDLDGKYIDVSGSNFTMKDLYYDTGWVANSDWTNFSITVPHGLGFDAHELYVDFLISIDGTDTNIRKIIAQGGSDGAAQDMGVTLYETDNNTLNLYSGDTGVYYINSDGARVLLDTESHYYRIIVSRKDAPQPGTYAYMRAANVQSVELLKKQTNRTDFSRVIYDATAPVSGIGPDDMLAFDGSTEHSWADYNELNAAKSALIAAGLFDDSTVDPSGSTFVLKEITPALGWRTVWQGAASASVVNAWGEGRFRLHGIMSSNNEMKAVIDTENITSPTADTFSPGIHTSSGNVIFFSYTRSTSTFSSVVTAYSGSITKIEKLEELAYAYLQTKSLGVIVAAESLSQPGYNGTVFRESTVDISAGTGSTALAKYASTGSSPKLDGWVVRAGWSGGDDPSTKYHTITVPAGWTITNGVDDLSPGDGSTTFWLVGFGSGELYLEKDEANSRWIIVGGIGKTSCFDKLVNSSGISWFQNVDRTIDYSHFFSQAVSSWSGSSPNYYANLTTQNIALPNISSWLDWGSGTSYDDGTVDVKIQELTTTTFKLRAMYYATTSRYNIYSLKAKAQAAA